ncbi:hypothetical protein [Thioalkalivibrio thiocyanodenitrificans]|uniref:hypothetical protein n=1 Tax=Thioalkalivibrio thiocyanodenitrificans TaxID=243063 RepID=UPI00035CB290|nr:hypothetical protein [Thioalkalivibrio thiocyanodenitrificans]
MVDVVASVQNALDILGKLRTLAKKIENAEFSMLLADLSSELADAKLEVSELKTKLASANEEKHKLAALLASRASGKPTLHEGVYQFEGEEGLFCTACFDTQEKKVRVTALTGPFKTFGKWECPSCKAVYG